MTAREMMVKSLGPHWIENSQQALVADLILREHPELEFEQMGRLVLPEYSPNPMRVPLGSKATALGFKNQEACKVAGSIVVVNRMSGEWGEFCSERVLGVYRSSVTFLVLFKS